MNDPFPDFCLFLFVFLFKCRIQPAFIAVNQHVRIEKELPGDIDWDVNATHPVEKFLIAVPHPQPKQRDGPKHLPMTMITNNWSRNKLRKNHLKLVEEEKMNVRNLGGLG